MSPVRPGQPRIGYDISGVVGLRCDSCGSCASCDSCDSCDGPLGPSQTTFPAVAVTRIPFPGERPFRGGGSLTSPIRRPRPTTERRTRGPAQRWSCQRSELKVSAVAGLGVSAVSAGRVSSQRWTGQRSALDVSAVCAGRVSSQCWTCQQSALDVSAVSAGRVSTLRWTCQQSALGVSALDVSAVSAGRVSSQR